MIERLNNSIWRGKAQLALALLLALALASPSLASGDKKKKKDNTPQKPVSVLDRLDTSKVVWPNPPAVTRVKYLNYFAGEKLPDFAAKPAKSKSAWMDRLAGATTDKGDDQLQNHFFMGEPHGLAVDSKGKIYVADSKVSAIFIINPETRDTEMIKNGQDASFNLITGLAIDDTDRLFVSDSLAHRILVFGPNHKAEAAIREGLDVPAGLAIDTENRFLYVADIELDQVLVYDVDTFKLLRRIGTGGKEHTLNTPGDFAKPTGVAVDKEGNLYVADMLNARVEIFDADGNFIRAFGKRGDGPGYFAMPKGVAVDCDGHIWVTDSVQNRVQLYTQEGQLLMYMGAAPGLLPGMFSGLQYITIDKNNRVFTSEVYPGRVQEFLYVTQEEARKEFQRREAEKNKSTESKPAPVGQPAAPASQEKQNDKGDAAAKAKEPATT
jgi:DNA-binding beta-propeller fold protein YncE